ncbi:hypothetical protein HDV00_003113 [Rhizophlyctis rosea]|nr:hypothetical protein HDV00_003113 [Rhizophlyctis rosea]
MTLITDEKEMYHDMRAFNLDVARLPSGQLSLKQVHEGYALLTELSNSIQRISVLTNYRGQRAHLASTKDEIKQCRNQLHDLCNAFYELIPFDFGSRRPELIDTLAKVKGHFDMLDVMSDVTQAMGIVKEELEKDDPRPEIDRIYNDLGTDISEVPTNDPEYRLVETYLNNTAADSRRGKIKNLYRVRRLEEVQNFTPHLESRSGVCEDDEGLRPNHMLLWHGSRVSNMVGILSKGLKIAPPEAPQIGLMFGKGIYFADAFAKSHSYAHGTKSKLMLLCEVALGQSTDFAYAEYMETPCGSSSSTKGMGSWKPERQGCLVTDEGVGVPMGKLVNKSSDGLILNYNEYIVYDTKRVKMRYLVEFVDV